MYFSQMPLHFELLDTYESKCNSSSLLTGSLSPHLFEDSTSSVLAFEKELDSMLAGMTVKETNHSPVHNNAMKTQGK